MSPCVAQHHASSMKTRHPQHKALWISASPVAISTTYKDPHCSSRTSQSRQLLCSSMQPQPGCRRQSPNNLLHSIVSMPQQHHKQHQQQRQQQQQRVLPLAWLMHYLLNLQEERAKPLMPEMPLLASILLHRPIILHWGRQCSAELLCMGHACPTEHKKERVLTDEQSHNSDCQEVQTLLRSLPLATTTARQQQQ